MIMIDTALTGRSRQFALEKWAEKLSCAANATLATANAFNIHSHFSQFPRLCPVPLDTAIVRIPNN